MRPPWYTALTGGSIRLGERETMEMRSRLCIGLASFVMVAGLVGCITITRTSTGDFDFEDRFDKSTKG
jgi:hypothetical protein